MRPGSVMQELIKQKLKTTSLPMKQQPVALKKYLKDDTILLKQQI